MIFVTEPFSLSRRVKSDTNEPGDTVEAFKLNFMRDFQTGVYDYNTMSSVFVQSSNFEPLKISFSSAEWCGHVYDELVFSRTEVSEKYFSYFDGESTDTTFLRPENGFAEEELLILIRSLRGEFLRPGESRSIRLLPEAFSRRLTHRTSEWSPATISRSQSAETVSVTLGSFSADKYELSAGPGKKISFWIEAAYPHRILRWAGDDQSGELTGSMRMPYWKLHSEGDEKYREKLGLAPPTQ